MAIARFTDKGYSAMTVHVVLKVHHQSQPILRFNQALPSLRRIGQFVILVTEHAFERWAEIFGTRSPDSSPSSRPGSVQNQLDAHPVRREFLFQPLPRLAAEQIKTQQDGQRGRQEDDDGQPGHRQNRAIIVDAEYGPRPAVWLVKHRGICATPVASNPLRVMPTTGSRPSGRRALQGLSANCRLWRRRSCSAAVSGGRARRNSQSGAVGGEHDAVRRNQATG